MFVNLSDDVSVSQALNITARHCSLSKSLQDRSDWQQMT